MLHIRDTPKDTRIRESEIADMPSTFETEEESAADSVHEFHVDTGQRVIYMRASSSDEKLMWMKALNVKYTPPGLYEDEEAQETPRLEELATSAGVMAAEYCPCVIRTGAAAPQLRSKLFLKSLKKIGGWQERWMLLQGEFLMAFDTEAAMNNVVERANRNDSGAFHGANPARCLVVHDVPAPIGDSEVEDKFEFHIDCEIVGKDERGMTVANAGTHRLFFLRARNTMEKQQWLHTLNPVRFSDIPPEGIPEGRPKGGMGIVGGAYRALDDVGEGMDKRLAREEAERAEEALRHDQSGILHVAERGARVGYENPKAVRGVKHNFSESQWQGVEAFESVGGKPLSLEERLAAKEADRLVRLAEKQKAAEEEAARKARGEEAKKNFLANKREELERSKAIQAAIAASKQKPEAELQPEPEPVYVEEEWAPPPMEEPEPARKAGIAGRFADEVAALEQAARSNPDNLVARVFESGVLNMMGSAKAKELLKALTVSFEHSDACGQQREALGCFISAAEDYRKLQPFMDQLIRQYFGASPSTSGGGAVPLHVAPDTPNRGGTRPSWEVEGVLPIEVKTAGPKCGARLRFNRNVRGPNFKLLAGYGDDAAARKDLEATLSTAVKGAFGVEVEGPGGQVVDGRYYSLTLGHEDFVGEADLSRLREVADGMIIPELVDTKYEPLAEILKLGGVLGCWPEGRGFWLASDRSVAVWVGAMEHVSLLVSGACKASDGGMAALLAKGRGLLERLRIAIGGEEGAWASHGEYGFVSTHPPNLGTGLRAVVRVAVPTLSKRGRDLGALSRAVAACGLAAQSQSGESFSGMEQLPRDGKCEVWRVVGRDASKKHEVDTPDGDSEDVVSTRISSPSFGLTEADAVEQLWAAVEELLGMEQKAKAVNAAAAKFY